MLVKNLTPFFHGATLTSRQPRQPEMCLVVRGTFKLAEGVLQAVEGPDQGFMSGDLFADDDPSRQGELLHPSDFADFKPNSEVMLRGTCHAPKQRAVRECPVRFEVGSWKKDVVVVGDRRWDRGLTGRRMTEPETFTRMPMGWGRAFGGKGNAHNPVGRGVEQDVLPNVELAEARITTPSDKPRPAGFGPINPGWPARAAKHGKNYGKSYLAERAPFYADDFDWSYFQAAPPDQQLRGYLRGDETVRLTNLHPEHAVLSMQLPSLRVRAFMEDDRSSFREITMVLDTLLVDGDAGRLYLCWRGLCQVREDDLSDVSTVLVASEPLASDPLAVEEYHDKLRAFAADPTGVLAALPPGLLEAYERQKLQKRGLPVPEEPLDPSLDPLSRALKSRLGGLVSKEDLAPLAAASAEMEKAHPGELEKHLPPPAPARMEAPQMEVRKLGRLPDPGLRARMRVVVDEAARLRAAEKTTGQKIEGIEKLEAMPHDPRWRLLDPSYEPPGPLSTDPPGPGADLRERDFSGQDLTGIDLSDANLERCNFTRAKLRGAKLRGAKLMHAVLYLADLEDADLEGADLTLVNGYALRAANARFVRATLSEGFFEAACFTGATLDEAALEYAILFEADLTGASLRKVKLDHADLGKSKLGGTNLSGASAVLALFGEASAEGANFSGATLTQTSFVAGDFRGASFIEARADKAFFMKAKLDDADFGYAVAKEAHFTEASAVGARFYGADLARSRFYRTNLERAELVRANLIAAELRKARVEGTRFIEANLYEASLIDIRGKGYDFSGANLKRSTIERAAEWP